MIAGSGTVLRPAAQSLPVGPPLVAGPFGQSAYDLAVSLGYTGTLSQWLASLVGAPGATTVAALTDMVDALKAVLRAADIPSARSALGLGNVANFAPADMPVSTAQGAAIAQAIANLVNSSPAALDTLKELADAIGDDPNFAATIAAQIGQKAASTRQITAGAGLTGGGDLSADRSLAIAANGVTNAMLAPAPALTLKANLLGSTAAITDVTPSQLLDAALGSTRGTIAVRGTTAWGGLALGANGTTLQSNGTDIVFAAASPGTGALRYDTNQSLSSGQQDQVRANVSGPISSTPSAATTLVATDFDRPLYPTGSPTITMANGGAGWRSGPILNNNTTSGITTLAVPSAATLDGVTNGTTTLAPKQKARIVQTGATAYITDWIDQSPIVAKATVSSSVSAVILSLPAGYAGFRVVASGIKIDTAGANLNMQFSSDGGSTFKSGSSDYNFQIIYASGSSISAVSPSASALELAYNLSSGTHPLQIEGIMHPGGSALQPLFNHRVSFYDNSGVWNQRHYAGRYSLAVLAANAIRIFPSSGGISAGTILLYGIPQ